MSKPTTILTVSNEILDLVFAYLDEKDIFHVALTSKKFTTCALLNLYKNIVFEVPQAFGCEAELVKLLGFDNDCLKYIRKLSVINGFERPDLIDTMGEDRRRGEDSTGDSRSGSSFDERGVASAGATDPLNRAMSGLLERIPANVLQGFRWTHRFPLGIDTLSALLVNHPSSLRELTIYDVDEDAGSTFTLPIGKMKLRKLDFRSVSMMHGAELFDLAYANRNTLTNLVVGSETRTFKRYTYDRKLELDPNSVRLEKLLRRATDPDLGASFPVLQQLHVISVNLRELQAMSMDPMGDPTVLSVKPKFVRFGNLRRLALESCQGSESFLRSLMRHQARPVFSDLEEFVFRHEQVTDSLYEVLNGFLSSFEGLKFLSILIDNLVMEPEDPVSFLEQHGPTLEVLVYETRYGLRLSFDDNTSLQLGDMGDPSSALSRIFDLCPTLRELSIPLDWSDHDVFGNLTLHPLVFRLQTFHIRNCPAWGREMLRTKDLLFAVHKYVEGLLEHALISYRLVHPDNETNLSLVAIGPTTYLEARRTQHHQCPELLWSRDDTGDLAHQHPSQCLDFYRQVQFFLPSWVIDRAYNERVIIAEFGYRELDRAMEFFPEGEYRCFETYWME